MLKDYYTYVWITLAVAELLESAGGEWIAGPSLTYADLALANFFDVAEDMVQDAL